MARSLAMIVEYSNALGYSIGLFLKKNTVQGTRHSHFFL
jgi:hypothetical protein